MTVRLPELIESSEALADLDNEFVAFADELGDDEDHLVDVELLRKDVLAYLCKLEGFSRGFGLPEGWVPQTTYWYLDNRRKIVGSSCLRHRLTPALIEFGGHISYVIRPCYCNQGHGTRLLAHTIKQARHIGLDQVLLTTDTKNVASRKIIEGNGGILSDEYLSLISGKPKARYLINLLEKAEDMI